MKAILVFFKPFFFIDKIIIIKEKNIISNILYY